MRKKQIIIPDKSIFNWIGGKKWLSKDINNILTNIEDKKIEIYIEPFAGGLGSFRAILPMLIKKNTKLIILNDINPILISTFKYIKNDIELLINKYEQITDHFFDTFLKEKRLSFKYDKNKKEYVKDYYYYYELNKTKDKKALKEIYLTEAENFYKSIRLKFNKNKLNNKIDIETIVYFLFLINNCFNGVYRENSKGEFNTPFNWGNKPETNKNKIDIFKEYNKLFNNINIKFTNSDVFELLNTYKEENNTFIYLDPPYFNENGNENKYSKNAFGKKEQLHLLEMTNSFTYTLYSNHYISFVEDFFLKQKNSIIKKVYRKNIMSSDNSTRGEDKAEILVLSIK